METSVSPLTRENLLEHENNHVMHQSSSQFVSEHLKKYTSNETGSENRKSKWKITKLNCRAMMMKEIAQHFMLNLLPA